MQGEKVGITLADLTFCLCWQKPSEVTERFLPFLNECCAADYTFRFCETPELPAFSAPALYRTPEYSVYRIGDRFVRLFFDQAKKNRPYAAAYCDFAEHCVQVDYLPNAGEHFAHLGNSLYHTGWERILAHENRLILHASCVDAPCGGILFSGVSGIGKSTQAALWERHVGAEQINGDRPILRKKDGAWLAYGSPYAGSSGVHVNRSCSVRTVVLLQQAEENSIRRVNAAEAFRRIYAGLIVQPWDAAFVQRACDLTQTLVDELPVYELSCTPDARAVAVLKEKLEKGD